MLNKKQLIKAVEQNNLQFIKSNLNTIINNKELLHQSLLSASKYNQTEILQLFLTNTNSFLKRTLKRSLISAIYHENLEAFNLLIENPELFKKDDLNECLKFILISQKIIHRLELKKAKSLEEFTELSFGEFIASNSNNLMFDKLLELDNVDPSYDNNFCFYSSKFINDLVKFDKLILLSPVINHIKNNDKEQYNLILTIPILKNISLNDITSIKEQLKNPNITSIDSVIRFSVECSNLESLKLFMNDKRSQPDSCNNLAIRNAFENKKIDFVRILFSDETVKASLKKTNKSLYEKITIWLNCNNF